MAVIWLLFVGCGDSVRDVPETWIGVAHEGIEVVLVVGLIWALGRWRKD